MNLNENHIECLKRAIAIQEEDHDETWFGFEWFDVGFRPHICNQLIEAGFFEMSYHSRSTRAYKIIDMDKARKATVVVPVSESFIDDEELVIPKDLFDIIIGHEQTKNILKLSLMSESPVHVLLVGEPATAKTLMLDELGRLPGSRVALGATTSSAGLVDFLIDTRPRYLIIDEIDKMNPRDQAILLSLMETGRVTRLKRNMRENITLNCTVFAGANSDQYVQRPLLSRFAKRYLQPYSESDFKAIATSILVKRERLEKNQADQIVTAIEKVTKDPRDAVKVGRLVAAGGNIQEVVSSLFG